MKFVFACAPGANGQPGSMASAIKALCNRGDALFSVVRFFAFGHMCLWCLWVWLHDNVSWMASQTRRPMERGKPSAWGPRGSLFLQRAGNQQVTRPPQLVTVSVRWGRAWLMAPRARPVDGQQVRVSRVLTRARGVNEPL